MLHCLVNILVFCPPSGLINSFNKIFSKYLPCARASREVLVVKNPPANIGDIRNRASLAAQMVKCLPAVQEIRIQSLGQEDSLEKEMATHSSPLAWKIPWTEKPGRLQSMGSQRVGHDWATSLSLSRNRGSIPGPGRSPGRGHSNPLQSSCLENPRDRGARQATVHWVTKSQKWREWFNTHTTCQALCKAQGERKSAEQAEVLFLWMPHRRKKLTIIKLTNELDNRTMLKLQWGVIVTGKTFHHWFGKESSLWKDMCELRPKGWQRVDKSWESRDPRCKRLEEMKPRKKLKHRKIVPEASTHPTNTHTHTCSHMRRPKFLKWVTAEQTSWQMGNPCTELWQGEVCGKRCCYLAGPPLLSESKVSLGFIPTWTSTLWAKKAFNIHVFYKERDED